MLQPTRNTSPRLGPLALVTCLVAAALCGCSGSSDAEFPFFESNDTKKSVAQDALVRMKERWILFQADEFTFGNGGTNYNAANGDTDKTDSIAVLVDMATKAEVNLRVAVEDMAITGAGGGAWIWLVVVEADDTRDWGGNTGTGDVVLLAARAAGATNATLTYVATLDGGGNRRLLVQGERVYFVEDESVVGALQPDEIALNYAEVVSGAPVVTRVKHAFLDPGTTDPLVDGVVEPDLVALDEGLLFFTVDETRQTPAGAFLIADLNGDGDDTDTHVLGVLDATDPAAPAFNVARAVAGDSTPVRARSLGNDWLVAFLVSEADQGGASLNDPNTSPDLPGGWQPIQCPVADTDASDEVLHWLRYGDFVGNPVLNDAVNTGLVGDDRVLALQAASGKLFVATISLEADAGCNLNGDSDLAPFPDRVFRWAPVGAGTAYVTGADKLLAVEDVAGESEGAAEFDQRFVIVVSEADDERNYDGNASEDNDLVGWIDPGLAVPVWVFDHNAANAGIQAAGSDWMAPRGKAGRLAVSFQEKLLGLSINSGGDNDTLDSAPSFARFQPADDLDFPGPPVAIEAGNAGIVFVGDLAFYRVDEAADNRDWNGVTGTNDYALFRTTVSTLGSSFFLGTLSGLPRPAVETAGSIGAAYLASEADADLDYNGDQDKSDYVLRWFRIP